MPADGEPLQVTAKAEPKGKVCAECNVRKRADSTQYFCTSTTADQLTARCRQCVFEEAKRSRLARDARKEHRRDLTLSRA